MVLKVSPSEARLIQVLTNQDRVDVHAMGRDVNRATAMSVSSVEHSSRRRPAGGGGRHAANRQPDQSQALNGAATVHHSVVYSARDHPAHSHRDGHRSHVGRHSRSSDGDRRDGGGNDKNRRHRHTDNHDDRNRRRNRHTDRAADDSRKEQHSSRSRAEAEETPMQREARELVQRKVVLAQIDMIKKVHGLKPEEPLATDASLSQCEWALFLLSRQVNMLQGCTLLGYALQGAATLAVTANTAVGKVLKIDDLEKDVREMCTTQQAVLARASLELPQLQMGPLTALALAFASTIKHCHDRNSAAQTNESTSAEGEQPANKTQTEEEDDAEAPDMIDAPDMFEMAD